MVDLIEKTEDLLPSTSKNSFSLETLHVKHHCTEAHSPFPEVLRDDTLLPGSSVHVSEAAYSAESSTLGRRDTGLNQATRERSVMVTLLAKV